MNSRIRQLIVGAGLVSGLAVAGLATGTGVNAAPPRSVVRVVAVGSAPDAIAVDPRANRALVVNSGENTVSVLDATTGLVLRTVPLGKTLTGLDNSAYAAATDELTGRAFVVTQGHPPVPSTVSILDTATGRVIRNTQVGIFAGAIAVDERTSRVFVTNLDSNTVSVLDARTGAKLRTVPVGQGPSGVTVVGRTGRVFVANSDSTVSLLDARTGALLRTVTTGRGLVGFTTIASGSAGQVFTFKQNGRVYTLDPTTGRVVSTWALGIMPGGTAFDPHTGQLYVSDLGPNGSGKVVAVLNARTGRLVHRIPTGRGPLGIVVDASARRVFVANYGGSTIRVLDADTGVTVRTIHSANPFAIAGDDQTHRVFVVNFSIAHRAGSVTVLDTRA